MFVTADKPLTTEEALRLGLLLDGVADSGSDATLNLTAIQWLSVETWLIIERCRSRFASLGLRLRMNTSPEGLTPQRRAAQALLAQLRGEG